MRIQAPHVFARKLIPQEHFPACIGFVLGGTFTAIISGRTGCHRMLSILYLLCVLLQKREKATPGKTPILH